MLRFDDASTLSLSLAEDNKRHDLGVVLFTGPSGGSHGVRPRPLPSASSSHDLASHHTTPRVSFHHVSKQELMFDGLGVCMLKNVVLPPSLTRKLFYYFSDIG